MEVLEKIAGSPQQWLKHCDEICKRAPAVLALFGELLDRLEEDRGCEGKRSDLDSLSETVPLFLSRLKVANSAKYQTVRERLLLFCLREDIAPEEVAEIVSSWASVLQNDWPLRYIFRACRLFWS